MDNHSNILEKFLTKWPLEKVKAMSLEEYTNLEKTSFTHWLESKTNDLGSIWGGSSYKFGIYKKKSSEEDKRHGYITDGKYAWVAQYGDTKYEAFQTIKNRICQIIELAQKNDLDSINSIPLGEAYKWKIAFLYSKEKFLPIYKKEALEIICKNLGISSGLSFGEMQKKILERKDNEESIYSFANKLWNIYESQKDNTQYWVFQCNPSEYNIIEEWKGKTQDTWKVTAHKSKIKSGDKVILWVTGKSSGCYGLCTVTSDVLQENSNYSVSLSIDQKLINQPIRKEQLIVMDEFSDFKGGNQGTNFRATKEQYEAIQQMITSNTNMKDKPLPLNQILYGPPGTGKTYHTVNKALEVIHGSDFCEGKDRSELLKEFNRLKEEGQIGFVTFHQSFSYEDFVEGITPLLLQNEESEQDKDGEVKYELKEGIFKKMCRIASGIPSDKVINNNNHDFDNSRYFKMSIGGKENPHIHDWCIKNGKVALGWGADSNFESVTDHVGNWPEFRDRFKEEFPELAKESRYHIQAMHAFLKMKKGDIVLVSKGNHVIDAVGVIADDEYIYDDQQNFGYYQFRNVHWLASNLNASPELFVSKNISQQTIYEFYDDDIKKEYLKRTFNNKNKSSLPEKYVLIIDEINRGNIAAIFGELITLIEPDKRLGNTEALQTQLPYSKEWFGVPSNLYIIGTMNTADRSVEALDTALRRRFSFEEMLPKPELVSPGYMLARLLWNYGKVDWNDKEYLEAEESLCSLLGTDKEFGKKKYKIWDSMEEEGFQLSYVEQFEKVNCSGINLKEILKAINSRIETLVDRDHTIGHSYFMNVKAESDLRLIFKDKIVPLLQEYFFGDFGKIGLVLGSSFVEKVPEEVQFAQIDGYEETAHLQKERYRLKTIDDNFDIKEALDLLMNKKEPQS